MIVTVGGSATTDGGAGALEALDGGGRRARRAGRRSATCARRSSDAPRVFGPQKGADPAMVERLTQRLDELAAQLRRATRAACR